MRTTSKKHVVDIVLRIDDDGSHSVEREKVFIYDIALMLNDFTQVCHPGLLVHDNIFDVDDDTLQKSLEFLLTRAEFEDDQQYILTLNVDRIEHCRQEVWYYELEQSVIASFTKSNCVRPCKDRFHKDRSHGRRLTAIFNDTLPRRSRPQWLDHVESASALWAAIDALEAKFAVLERKANGPLQTINPLNEKVGFPPRLASELEAEA